MAHLLKKLRSAEAGATAIEYALIVSTVSVAGLIGIDFMQGLIESPLTELNSGITIHMDDGAQPNMDDIEAMVMGLMGFDTRA